MPKSTLDKPTITVAERRAALADKQCPCASGDLTKNCHASLLHPPTEAQFFDAIQKGLSLAPKFAALIPTGFPKGGRASVSYDRAMEFEEVRTTHHGHNINLPLILHLAGSDGGTPGARALANQMLGIVEQFATRFWGFPGAKRSLEALWLRPWDAHDPVFWSVISACYFALRLSNAVRGFERPTGKGEKSADILVNTSERTIHVEVEIWHSSDATTSAQLREQFLGRAVAKAEKKFPHFAEPHVGVVIQVLFPNAEQLKMLRDERTIFEPVELKQPERWVGHLIAVANEGDSRGALWGAVFLDHTATVRLSASGGR